MTAMEPESDAGGQRATRGGSLRCASRRLARSVAVMRVRTIALVLCALTACSSSHRAPSTSVVAPANAAPAVADASVAPALRPRATSVERRTMRLVERSEVTIALAVTASAVAHTSGVATVVSVDANDRVRRGQVLATIGPANGATGRTEQVRAPIDGSVITRNVEPTSPVEGDRTVLFTIGDLTRLTGRAAVPEARANSLRVGLPVELRVDAMPDRVFASTVTRVGPTISAARAQPFEFPLANADMTLRPGMRGEARLELERHEDTLVVSDEALTSYADPTVFVVTDGHARPVSVRFGIRADGVTEITEGLRSEDRVLVPAALVREGDAVDE